MAYNFTENDRTDYSTLIFILCAILLVITLCCTLIYTYFTYKLKRSMRSYDILNTNTFEDRPAALIQTDDYTDNSHVGLLSEDIQTFL